MNTLISSVKDVLKLIPISKTTMHDLINDGLFPKPIQIGKQKTGFIKSEIDAWIEQRIKDREEGQGAEERRARALKAVGGRS